MTFEQACIEAVKKAREHGTIFYVFDAPNLWEILPSYRKDWLFQAYPGGRKILATEGRLMLADIEATKESAARRE
jgi:hypothetical protein